MITIILLLALIAVFAVPAAIIFWRKVSRALGHLPKQNDDFHLF
jgi:hypothetical protein